MLTNVHSKSTVELYKTPIVQQTAFWSIVKKKVGQKPIALNFKTRNSSLYNNFSNDATINSDLLIIIQQLNKTDSIAYVPYGPELEPAADFQGLFLEELSECIRSFLPINCFMVRYDLCWEVFWANDNTYKDKNGNFLDEPSVKSQEIRFNINTNNWNIFKAQSNILPSSTLFIGLKADTNTILARMKPKTRYNIKLAQKKGVKVRVANLTEIDIWYKLYTETALRNGIRLNNLNYFEAILSTKADNTKSPAEVIYLIAEIDSTPLAAMFLVISGNRGSYLYGASSGSKRNYMAPYALQWEAIKISKHKGCTEYDMFGISPNNNQMHPMYGLYKFKIGFGGQIYRSLGCWDYPFDHDKYKLFKGFELSSKGFHL